jgi:Ser/Thr protein kinase RdoA (MazF antagonist)
MFGAADPASALGAVTRGFDATCRLTADELDALPSLVLARLGASVAISAVQWRLAPDPYLRVSEASAWRVIEWFMAQPPSAVRLAVHEAAGR